MGQTSKLIIIYCKDKKKIGHPKGWAREIIQKSLTLDSGKFVSFIQTFGSLVNFSYNLVLVL